MKRQPKTRGSLWRLLTLARPYTGSLLIAMACLVVANLTELFKPYLMELIIDNYIVPTQSDLPLGIGGMSITYFATVLLGSVMTILQIRWMNRAGQDIIRGLRDKVFVHVQHMPLSALDKFSSGRLVTRGTNDVEALSDFFSDVMLGLLKDAILLIGLLTAMLLLEWKLALVSMLILPLIVAVVWGMRRMLRPLHAKMKSLTGRINGFIAETLSGMRVVQSFQAHRAVLKEFNKYNEEYNVVSKRRVMLNSINRPIIDVINTLAVALILWYGMGRIMGDTLSIGILYAFTSYIKQFFEPIMDFAEKYDTIQSAETSADRIFELLDTTSQEALEEGDAMQRPKGEIRFDHVWFAYSGENWVLKDVSFTVKPGEHLALVGHTGSGKSTTISLLCRFYDVQKGAIYLDGVDITTLKKADLRRVVATVLQDPFLFSGSVYDNIALNTPVTEKQVNDAIDTACAREVVERLAGGIHQPVRERGSALSVGQRQLVAFARAVAHDPAVLILDEATAHIDTHTESLLQQSLARVSRGRTTITVAHRLSTIRDSDQILVLEEGEVVERGNHSSLLAQWGRYYQLYLAQGLEAQNAP